MAFDKPQSRNEAILQNMLGANNELEPPKSRVEALLQDIAGQMPEANPSEGTTTGTLERIKIGDDIYSVEGGGSGTSDYDALNNKPQIAGTTLSGNKSLADLGIASASTVSGILDGASIDSFADVETALAGKQGTLTFDSAPTNESTNPVTSGGVYTALAGKVDKTSVGVASGVAGLDSNGKVPSAQLPSYVDDVVNGYLHDGKFYADDQYTTEITGEEGKIYVDLATNKTYRWSGLAFVEISESLALGETSSTAYAGDKGKANADAISAIKDGQTIDSFADVETALAGKQDTLTFDNTPTQNSTNPVKSGGVYSALDEKADTDIVASDFDATASYTAGNYCIYEGKFYKFKASHSGAWSAADVDEIKIAGELSALKSGLINQTARSRSNITSRLTNLATAVAEQNLEKYGYKIGDYFTGTSGYIYHLADMDTFYGSYNNNAIVNTHHISLVVKTGTNSKWAETNDTSGGYKTSTLHSFLSSTVLDNIKSDMIALFGGSTGLEHLVSHKLLWTTATSGAWAWSDNAEYISALSEPQVYGTNVWAIDGYQTGEAWKWLEIFHKFNFCEILGNIWWWLRSISSASYACYASGNGRADSIGASYSPGAVGLIIFH